MSATCLAGDDVVHGLVAVGPPLELGLGGRRLLALRDGHAGLGWVKCRQEYAVLLRHLQVADRLGGRLHALPSHDLQLRAQGWVFRVLVCIPFDVTVFRCNMHTRATGLESNQTLLHRVIQLQMSHA